MSWAPAVAIYAAHTTLDRRMASSQPSRRNTRPHSARLYLESIGRFGVREPEGPCVESLDEALAMFFLESVYPNQLEELSNTTSEELRAQSKQWWVIMTYCCG